MNQRKLEKDQVTNNRGFCTPNKIEPSTVRKQNPQKTLNGAKIKSTTHLLDATLSQCSEYANQTRDPGPHPVHTQELAGTVQALFGVFQFLCSCHTLERKPWDHDHDSLHDEGIGSRIWSHRFTLGTRRWWCKNGCHDSEMVKNIWSELNVNKVRHYM